VIDRQIAVRAEEYWSGGQRWLWVQVPVRERGLEKEFRGQFLPRKEAFRKNLIQIVLEFKEDRFRRTPQKWTNTRALHIIRDFFVLFS